MKTAAVTAVLFSLLSIGFAHSQSTSRAMVDGEKVCGHGAVVDMWLSTAPGDEMVLGVQLVYTPWSSDKDTDYLHKRWLADPGEEPYLSPIGIWSSVIPLSAKFDKTYDLVANAFALGAPIRILSRSGACNDGAEVFEIKLCGKAPCLDDLE